MASIRKRDNKDGTTGYQVLIRNQGVEREIKTYPTRQQAEDAKADANSKIKNCPPKPTNLSDEVKTKQMMDQKLIDLLADFTASGHATQGNLNILPTLVKNIGKIRVGEIRRSWTVAFIKHMRSLVSIRTGRPYADATIASLIWTANAAVKWRANQLDLPHPDLHLSIKGIDGDWDVKRDRRLEAGEEEAILSRLLTIEGSNRNQWVGLFQLAIETAARREELVSAQWSEFDLAKRVWTIPLKKTKSEKTRAVPLTERAMDVLERMKAEETPASARVFHSLAQSATSGTSNSVSTCFHRYVADAGVVGFRLHDLRHEGASRMAIYWRDFTMFELMLIVGHTTMEMFQRYANLRADDLVRRLPTGPHQGPPAVPSTAKISSHMLVPLAPGPSVDFPTFFGQTRPALGITPEMIRLTFSNHPQPDFSAAHAAANASKIVLKMPSSIEDVLPRYDFSAA